ncbi:glycosyltransferase family 2 protein [Novosphingobium sp. RD2P27]|uniref:Glycosyltransferase family 2 protein n=1 Tax=Novosphingobium kalidii TaxID=3230299 RepID=A0ABV2CZL7_9SPHN
MTRLALVMIVKNEARCLGRCLESVKRYVDRMIVLDTGSTDNTVEIAKSFGAEVYHYEWQNDFAAARNAALEKSDAAWNLVLDADEWLVSGFEALSEANLPLHPSVASPPLGCVRVTNAGRNADEPDRRNYLARVLPRGVRYEGRVHEQPEIGRSRVHLPILLGHDGYTPEQLGRKKGRNEYILRAELEANPENGFMWYQLGREHLAYEEFAEAADCMMCAYRFVEAQSYERQEVVIYALVLLRLVGRHEEALALADAEQDNWEDVPDFFFAVAELYLEWASLNPEIAQDLLLPVVEGAWLKCIEIGEQPHLNCSVEGSGSYRAAYNLSNFYKILGYPEQADKYQHLGNQMRVAAMAA